MPRSQDGFFRNNVLSDPISEVGDPYIDEAIFSWAISLLNPELSTENISQSFSNIIKAYNSDERFFHRGLGHPRELLPSASQRGYLILMAMTKESTHALANLIERFNSFIPINEKLREAQAIISAFYHDVVHRCDKLHKKTTKIMPLTALIFAAEEKDTIQQKSANFAENEMTRMQIAIRDMLPILLAIYGTIPFGEHCMPCTLRKHLIHITNTLQVTYSDLELNEILGLVIGVSNRDMSRYGCDSLSEFNKKILAILYENHPTLRDEQHGVDAEIQALYALYDFHRGLFNEITINDKPIFFNLDPDDQRVKTLNEHAKQILKLDICLQSLLIATLKLKNYFLEMQIDDNQFIDQHLPHANEDHLTEVSQEVIDVLSRQGEAVNVNGLSFTRGTETCKSALDFIKIFGLKRLLNITMTYPDDHGYIERLLGELDDDPSPTRAA